MTSFSSRQPRRQRRALYEAHTAERRHLMTIPLSKELRTRYGRRNLPVRKGDTVRVTGGSFKGRDERVAKVDRRTLTVTLDNVTVKKADQKLKPLPMRPAHLILTKLNLSDPWRRRIIKAPEEPAPEEASKPESPSSVPSAEPPVGEPEVPQAEARPRKKKGSGPT